MKKSFVLTAIFVSLALVAFAVSVSAQPINTTNYTISSSIPGIQISQLRYTPYPANPGEYVDVWIEAQFYGANPPINATFILQPKFPFSLDSNESAVQSFGQVGYNTVVLHYKVRIDPNAVPGNNELDLAYSPDGTGNTMLIKPMEIDVQNAQTGFSLVIQDSTSSGTSIGIANTGENTANSLIVKIPQQPNFRVTGITNGQILGNLNAGDYTLATFQLQQINRDNNTLEVELDYTDAIGIRRDVIEDVVFGQTPSTEYNSTGNFASSGSGAIVLNGQNGAYFQRNFQRRSIFDNAWFWVVAGIIVVIGGLAGFRTYRKRHIKSNQEKKEKKNSKEPDWVTAERKKGK